MRGYWLELRSKELNSQAVIEISERELHGLRGSCVYVACGDNCFDVACDGSSEVTAENGLRCEILDVSAEYLSYRCPPERGTMKKFRRISAEMYFKKRSAPGEQEKLGDECYY